MRDKKVGSRLFEQHRDVLKPCAVVLRRLTKREIKQMEKSVSRNPLMEKGKKHKKSKPKQTLKKDARMLRASDVEVIPETDMELLSAESELNVVPETDVELFPLDTSIPESPGVNCNLGGFGEAGATRLSDATVEALPDVELRKTDEHKECEDAFGTSTDMYTADDELHQSAKHDVQETTSQPMVQKTADKQSVIAAKSSALQSVPVGRQVEKENCEELKTSSRNTDHVAEVVNKTNSKGGADIDWDDEVSDSQLANLDLTNFVPENGHAEEIPSAQKDALHKKGQIEEDSLVAISEKAAPAAADEHEAGVHTDEATFELLLSELDSDEDESRGLRSEGQVRDEEDATSGGTKHEEAAQTEQTANKSGEDSGEKVGTLVKGQGSSSADHEAASSHQTAEADRENPGSTSERNQDSSSCGKSTDTTVKGKKIHSGRDNEEASSTKKSQQDTEDPVPNKEPWQAADEIKTEKDESGFTLDSRLHAVVDLGDEEGQEISLSQVPVVIEISDDEEDSEDPGPVLSEKEIRDIIILDSDDDDDDDGAAPTRNTHDARLGVLWSEVKTEVAQEGTVESANEVVRHGVNLADMADEEVRAFLDGKFLVSSQKSDPPTPDAGEESDSSSDDSIQDLEGHFLVAASKNSEPVKRLTPNGEDESDSSSDDSIQDLEGVYLRAERAEKAMKAAEISASTARPKVGEEISARPSSEVLGESKVVAGPTEKAVHSKRHENDVTPVRKSSERDAFPSHSSTSKVVNKPRDAAQGSKQQENDPTNIKSNEPSRSVASKVAEPKEKTAADTKRQEHDVTPVSKSREREAFPSLSSGSFYQKKPKACEQPSRTERHPAPRKPDSCVTNRDLRKALQKRRRGPPVLQETPYQIQMDPIERAKKQLEQRMKGNF